MCDLQVLADVCNGYGKILNMPSKYNIPKEYYDALMNIGELQEGFVNNIGAIDNIRMIISQEDMQKYIKEKGGFVRLFGMNSLSLAFLVSAGLNDKEVQEKRDGAASKYPGRIAVLRLDDISVLESNSHSDLFKLCNGNLRERNYLSSLFTAIQSELFKKNIRTADLKLERKMGEKSFRFEFRIKPEALKKISELLGGGCYKKVHSYDDGKTLAIFIAFDKESHMKALEEAANYTERIICDLHTVGGICYHLSWDYYNSIYVIKTALCDIAMKYSARYH